MTGTPTPRLPARILSSDYPGPRGRCLFCCREATFESYRAFMIPLTRLNNKRFVVNADHIRYLESTPDTIITLENGDKFMVKEPLDDVIKLVIEYHRQIHALNV